MRPATIEKLQARAGEIAALLKTLSHPTRLLIACELREGERSVGALEIATGARQSALSRDLARLRAAGLVKARRESKSVFYRLSDARLARIIDALCGAFGPGDRIRKKK
jgi:ArsR family transcriptional regulator